MDTEHGPDQEQEKYSFIEEVIKEEQMSGRRLFQKIGKRIVLGLVFGMAAAIGFVILKPWVQETFQNKPQKVDIPQDEEVLPNAQQGDSGPSEQLKNTEDYQRLIQLFNQSAEKAQKSIVKINGIENEGYWLESQGEVTYSTSGLIVADNGYELLILANYTNIKDAGVFQVEFPGGEKQEASLLQSTSNINMAILSVSKDAIDKRTWREIEVAALGNSNTLAQGAALIALGNPHGYMGGVSYEILQSADTKNVRADGEYSIIRMDSGKMAYSNGFLFDVYGRVMGVIDSQLTEEGDVLAAWGISSVKREIELMSNGQQVPYIGIIGTWVTPALSEKLDMPKGLYVKSVEVGSPAMQAGIQTGDIITVIGQKEIETLIGYHNSVMSYDVGENIKINGIRLGAEDYVEITFGITVGVRE